MTNIRVIGFNACPAFEEQDCVAHATVLVGPISIAGIRVCETPSGRVVLPPRWYNRPHADAARVAVVAFVDPVTKAAIRDAVLAEAAQALGEKGDA